MELALLTERAGEWGGPPLPNREPPPGERGVVRLSQDAELAGMRETMSRYNY
jgi:hypothetical protein